MAEQQKKRRFSLQRLSDQINEVEADRAVWRAQVSQQLQSQFEMLRFIRSDLSIIKEVLNASGVMVVLKRPKLTDR